MRDEMAENEIKLNKIICGKSQDKLKAFPDNFFDGIVTDPPYELNFMNKAWDASGIAYNTELWKEVLRVSKPGSFAFVFGGTRTYHRVACAIEDAGWQIKDSIDYIYGSGFPKSTSISKQIDKEAGLKRKGIFRTDGKATNSGSGCYQMNNGSDTSMQKVFEDGPPITDDAKQWESYGTALKPAHEPIIVAMKPLEKGLTYAANAQKWNVAGLNIDGCRISTNEIKVNDSEYSDKGYWNNIKEAGQAKRWTGGGTNNSAGRWPSNIILSHSPDCVCVGTKQINEGAPEDGYSYGGKEYEVEGFVKTCKPKAPSNRGQETVEVYACVPDCPIRIMDSQSGESQSIRANRGRGFSSQGSNDGYKRESHNNPDFQNIVGGFNDSGGASRFFYCAKASRGEREKGLKEFTECVKCGKFNSKTHTAVNPETGLKSRENCTRNNHPTVKPVDLMRYLLTLIKMPSAKENKQVILDPFCGSGTTLVAAEQLGINYIGIDQDSDNVLISMGRIGAPDIFEDNCEKPIKTSEQEAFDDFDLCENLSSSDFEDLILKI